ncbi:MAG: sigma-70 family RNA polymerase sigma factor, partial [Cyanobacteria bacterium P01_F01_bin.4]
AARAGAAKAANLKQSAHAARTYLNPSVTSLNQPQFDGTGQERLDDLSAPEVETPMGQLLVAEAYAEQQVQLQQMGDVLAGAIADLDPPAQHLLRLYYQQSLTQKDIAEQLHIKQYQVSRQLSRARQQLLLRVAHWSQETLHISIDSTVLASVNTVIHEWLEHHYPLETPEVSK